MEPQNGGSAPAAPAVVVHTVRAELTIPGQGYVEVSFRPDYPPSPLPDPAVGTTFGPGGYPVSGGVGASPMVAGTIGDGHILNALLALASNPQLWALLQLLGLIKVPVPVPTPPAA